MNISAERACVEAAQMLRIPLRIERRGAMGSLCPESSLLFADTQFPNRDEALRMLERMAELRPYRVIDRAAMNWIFITVGAFALRFGPFLPEMLTRSETTVLFQGLMRNAPQEEHVYEGENEAQRRFREYTMRAPLVDERRALDLLRFCCHVLVDGEPLKMESFSLLGVDPLRETKANYDKYIGYREDCEAAFVAAVAHGGDDKALEVLGTLYENAPVRADFATPWQEGFFHFCTIRAHARQGARRAGVPAAATERVVSACLGRALCTESAQELRQIASEMTRALCALVRTCSNHSYSPLVSNVIDYIASNYARDISTGSIAREFGVNASYLSARFHRETGETLSACLTRTRLECARTLLTMTDMDIGDIGADVGVPDSNYFSRIFRRQYGVSPGEYRLKLIGRKGRR